jgi:hypothetical protein
MTVSVRFDTWGESLTCGPAHELATKLQKQRAWRDSNPQPSDPKFSPRTEQVYVDWIKRYIRFHSVFPTQ